MYSGRCQRAQGHSLSVQGRHCEVGRAVRGQLLLAGAGTHAAVAATLRTPSTECVCTPRVRWRSRRSARHVTRVPPTSSGVVESLAAACKGRRSGGEQRPDRPGGRGQRAVNDAPHSQHLPALHAGMM